MTRPRPVAALFVSAAVMTVLGGPMAVPAFADAPTAQGWWSSTHQGAQPPAPPDVPVDGLLVQGAAAQPVAPGAPTLSDTPAQPASTQALSALTFAVPTGSAVESLVLKVAGDPPESTTVSACVVTGSYEPVQNGEFATRPTFDCTLTAVPVLDATAGTLSFDRALAALVRGGSLSFVLLPGRVDRLVLQKPGASSLVLRRSGGAGAPGPAAFDPGEAPALEGTSFGGGFGSAGPPSDFGTTVPPLDSSTTLGVGSPLPAAPEMADLQALPPALGGPRTGPTSLTAQGAPDRSTRTVLLLALFVVGAILVLSGRPSTTATTPAVPAPIPPQERGVGRFRKLRDRRAVPL